MVRLALELVGPCVVLGFSVCVEAFDELRQLMFPGVIYTGLLENSLTMVFDTLILSGEILRAKLHNLLGLYGKAE